MQNRVFQVGKKPYCVWGHNLVQDNLIFLSQIDSDFFLYQADVNAANLKSDGRKQQHAALALRANYLHATEVFFAIAMATIQAPACPVGWVFRYRSEQLRQLVEDVARGRSVSSPWWSSIGKSWRDFASTVLSRFKCEPPTDKDQVTGNFGEFWQRIADEFLSADCSAEYNSFKHGLRARASPVQVGIGRQDDPETPCPPEKMTYFSSDSGSSWVGVEAIEDDRINLRVFHRSVAWHPGSIHERLQLVSVSINNVVAWLESTLGAKSPREWKYPPNLMVFDECWHNTGLCSIGFQQDITLNDIRPVSREEMITLLKQQDKTA